MVFIKKVTNADSGDSDHVGGNDWDALDDYFDDVATGRTAEINTDTTFRSGKFKLRDSDNSHSYTINTSNLSADRTITEPLLTGNDTRVYEAHTQALTNKTIDLKSNSVVQYNQWKYVVFIDGSNKKCMDMDTGTIVSTNTSASTVLQYAVDNAAGSPILIKRGTYVLTSELNCNDKLVWIVGEAKAHSTGPNTVLQKAGSGNIIQMDNASATAHALHLENLLIDGVDKLGSGVFTDNVKECFDLFKNIKIQSCNVGWHHNAGHYLNIWNINVTACNTGIWFDNNGVPATMSGAGNTICFYGGKIGQCTTHNVDVDVFNEELSFFGTVLESDQAMTSAVNIDSEAELVSFHDCSFENYISNAIIIHDEGKNTRVINCRFQINDTGLNYTAYEGVGAKNPVLVGNQFGASTTGTIFLTLDSSTDRAVLIGNMRRRWILPLAITLTDSGANTTLIGNSFIEDKYPNISFSQYKAISAPSTPASGFARVYLDVADGKLKIKKSSGSVVDLEA